MIMYGIHPSEELEKQLNSAQNIKTEQGEAIPKVIHYCWFGGNPLPGSAVKCIESWKKYLPEFQIVEWNESNVDIHAIPYVAEAYERKKYAFVSDFVRFAVLYLYGGIYFDTDVEVIKDMRPIVERGAFMGCEKDGGKTQVNPAVAPGLGLGVNPGLGLYKKLIESYLHEHFIREDGSNNITTIVDRTTSVLCEYGLQNTNQIQYIGGVYIYPKEYFCPKVMDSDEINITENTYSIHHYDATWAEEVDKKSGRRAYKLKKVLGNRLGGAVNTVIYGYEKYGIIGSIKRWAKRK